MRVAVITAAILVTLAGLSCNDSLPPYVAPSNFLNASIRNVSAAEVYYSYWDTGNNVHLTNLSISTSPQVFFVDVVSTYEEILQDKLELSGTLEFALEGISSARVTIPFETSGITGNQYNPQTNVLTLAPFDTLKIKCLWRYKTDDGKWAFERANVAKESPVYNGMDVVHVPLTFTATAHVKLFRSTNTVTSTGKEFQLVFFGHIYIPVKF